MSCTFWMDRINIPEDKFAQVEALLEKHDLKWIIDVSHYDAETKNEAYIDLSDFEMSYSTASAITDDLFPDLAELIKGTPFDGQLNVTECDGEPTSYFLYNGKVKEIDGRPTIIKPEPPIEIGIRATVNTQVDVLGLPNGQAVIVKYY